MRSDAQELPMTNDYFKFTPKHKVDCLPDGGVSYEFFDRESPSQAEAAFNRAMRRLGRFEGSVTVWELPGFQGKWTTYGIKEIGR